MKVIIDLLHCPNGYWCVCLGRNSYFRAIDQKIWFKESTSSLRNSDRRRMGGSHESGERMSYSLHEQGTKRIFTSLKIGTRVDKEQTMEDKVNVVEQKLNQDGQKK